MSVLAAIAVLALLIVVHELGHFMAARLQGIHANRFSVGFGPVLVKYQGPETEYAIRAFPLGGFVGFPDDDPDSTIPPDDPNLLRNRPILDRAIVISAGVIANLIFAYFLLVAQVGFVGVPELNYQPGVQVPELTSEVNSAASKAGIKPGDVILAVDGKSLGTDKEAITSLMREIQTHPNQPLDLTLQRNDQTLHLTVTPESGKDGKGQVGVRLAANGKIVRQRVNNIVEIGANIAKSDAAALFNFAALISINLAIINILPLPALDGGQLAFLLIEGLRGKPVPTKIQDGVMQTGLKLLLGLGIFLIIKDTTNLEGIQQFFK